MQVSRLFREISFLRQKLQKEPTSEEIATAIDKPVEYIEKLLEISRSPKSLDEYIDEDGDSTLGDFIEDKGDDVIDQSEYKFSQEQMRKLLDTLDDPRDRKIIELRFGLSDGDEYYYTLEEVAKIVGGITKERVRQIEDKVLRNLRKKAIQMGWKLKIEKVDDKNKFQEIVKTKQPIPRKWKLTPSHEFIILRQKIGPLLYLIEDSRDLEIMELRYGLRDGYKRTLEEVGKIVGGITRERVRQIEDRVLKDLGLKPEVKKPAEEKRKRGHPPSSNK